MGVDPCFLCFGAYGAEVFRDKIPRDEQVNEEPLPAPASVPIDAPLSGAEVGERLLLARERRALSRAALGRQAKLAHSAIGYIEEGKTVPSIASVELLAVALKVSACWLGFGRGDGPQSTNQAASEVPQKREL